MLEELERQWKAKDKEIVDVIEDFEIDKLVSEKEVSEFLKLMKHSEYSVVKQLEENPCQDIPNVSYLVFQTPPQCAPKCEQDICALRYGPKDYRASGQNNLCNKLPILHCRRARC